LNIQFIPEDEVADHPWIGRRVRGIAEKQFGVFERPGKILKIKDNGKIVWLPEDRLVSWTTHIDDLEFLPALKERSPWKHGKLSAADMMEIKIRLPDLKKRLGKIDELQDLHVVLGNWLVYRDFLRDNMKAQEMPVLVNPQAVYAFLNFESTEDGLEMLSMSKKILLGLWKRHGLLGFPIQMAGHWTLLVFRRSSHETQIRYYDSLENIQAQCFESAKKIVELLEPDRQVPERRNTAIQPDSISCGLFVLHYWEGEVRQFTGEGWSVGKPSPLHIKKIRERLMNITVNIEQSQGKVLELPKKAKVTKAEIEKDMGLPYLPAAEKIMAHLKADANRSQNLGLVEFYGCSRCRWSRGGCISWRCNHQKFMVHYEKFPEKYEGKCKELKLVAEQNLTKCELLS
jgi:hypothetical protein